MAENLPAVWETWVCSLGWEDPLEENSHQCLTKCLLLDFSGGSDGKESACSVGDLGLIPGLEDPLEEGVATHSSILTRRIAWQAPLSMGFSRQK